MTITNSRPARPRRNRVLAGLILLSVPTATLAAVEPPLQPPDADSGFTRAGGFWFRPRLLMRNVGYDSNIFLSADEEPVGDWTATLTPALDVLTLFGNHGRFEASQAIDLVGYLDTSSQNHTNSRTRLAGDAGGGDLRFSAESEYRTEELRPGAEIDERVRLQTGRMLGGLAWSGSGRSEIRVRGSVDRYDYSGNETAYGTSLTELNRDERRLTVAGRWRALRRTHLLLEWSDEAYVHEQATLGRDADARRMVAGLRFDPGAVLVGEVRAGYLAFTPDDPARIAYDGPVGTAQLRARVGSRVAVTLSGARDINFSVYGDNLFYDERTLGLELSTALSRRFRLEAGVTRTALEWPVPVAFSDFSGVRARTTSGRPGSAGRGRRPARRATACACCTASAPRTPPARAMTRPPCWRKPAIPSRPVRRLLLTLVATLGLLPGLASARPDAAVEERGTIGAEDLLDIRVVGVEALSSTVRVSETGQITLPLLGAIDAAGLTPAALELLLAGRLEERYVNDPQVSVFVKEHGSRMVSVLGAVRDPGRYPMIGRRTLLDMVSAAGGLTDEAGPEVVITHRAAAPGGEAPSTVVDLEALLHAGKDELNLPIAPGDLIHVPVDRPVRIYVDGAVKTPGEIETRLSRPLTLMQALAKAGGATERASLRRVEVLRRRPEGGQERFALDVRAVRKGEAADMVLMDGDVVLVPEAYF